MLPPCAVGLLCSTRDARSVASWLVVLACLLLVFLGWISFAVWSFVLSSPLHLARQLDTFSKVYKTLTGKDVSFEFRSAA